MASNLNWLEMLTCTWSSRSIRMSYSLYPIHYHRIACQYPNHNQLVMSPRDAILCISVHEKVVGKRHGQVLRGLFFSLPFYFFSFSKVWRMIQPRWLVNHIKTIGTTWETVWVDRVTWPESVTNWASPAFIKTCHHIICTWLWCICLMFPY